MLATNPSRKAKSIFGLIVSILFSLAMNIIFLSAYGQQFTISNWAMQLPLTIPAGSIVGIGVGIFLSKKAPHTTPFAKGLLFSIMMSIVMSMIMVPFALIPRMGFDVVILIKAIVVGVPVGVAVSYLVVPFAHWLVFMKWQMPNFK